MFGKHKATKDGLRTECKPCANSYQNTYRKTRYKDQDYKYLVKLAQVKKLYGLSQIQYEKMVKSGCQVCGSIDKLCIDHDHSCCPGAKTCGKCIRGILCHKCNSAEGYLKSDLDLIMKLYEHVKRGTQWQDGQQMQ